MLATSPRAAAGELSPNSESLQDTYPNVDLISRATSAPNTYVFAELLSAPNIQALADSDQSSFLTLLKIFTYGTYSTYIETSSLPKLGAAQTLKLRQLSLMTLAQDPSNLSYSKLISALGLSTDRELEDLVISAIYAGLVEGTLDPYNRLVLLSAVSPLRDSAPNSIPSIITTLSTWSARCTTTLADLDAQIASIRSVALKRARDEKDWVVQVERLLDGPNFKEKPEDSWHVKPASRGPSKRVNTGSGESDGDEGVWDGEGMEIDDDDDVGRGNGTKPHKKRGGFMSFGKQ